MKVKVFSLLLGMLYSMMEGNCQGAADTIEYRRPLLDFEYGNPLFPPSGLANPPGIFRFISFTGYREGVKSIEGPYGYNIAVTFDASGQSKRFSMFNESIVDMLIHFQTDNMLNNPRNSRIILDVQDPSHFRYLEKYGSKEEWYRKNSYCFEMMIPFGFPGEKVATDALNKIIADHFNISFGFEKRKVETLVLVRISGEDKISSKKTGREEGKNGLFRNVGFSFLELRMDQPGMMPFVNETGYDSDIDMDLGPVDYTDVPALRKALQRYDLDLKIEQRELEMFVIKEKR